MHKLNSNKGQTVTNRPGRHHEDEASLFLPIGQPSQGFGDNQLNGLELSTSLVLFSQHAKPENSKCIHTYMTISC